MMLINPINNGSIEKNKKKLNKVSKNRKKSWRKHTDISEFEEYLNDKRFEERLGHSIIDAKNDDLFIIEKQGDDSVYEAKLKNKLSKDQNLINNIESKLKKITNEYRYFQKLLPTSKVSPILIQKQNKNQKHTIHNDDDKLIKYWNDHKNLIDGSKQVKKFKQNVRNDSKLRFKNDYDLWNDDNNNNNDVDELINKTIKKKVPEHLRQKPSLLPAIETPLPGQSYNPDEKDYQELIQSEVEKELNRINEEKMWEKKLEKYFLTKKEAQQNEIEYQNEMLQGLLNDDNQSDDNDNEIIMNAINSKKQLKRKTKQQKRREQREKQLKKQKQQEKLLKIKENDVYRIKSIEKELNEREKKLKKRLKLRQQKHIESLYKPKRLSRYNFEETPLELNLPNEITGSLRSLKTEGNILKDRYKSLQKRNLIETRILQNKKRSIQKMEMKRRFRE